MPEVVCRHAISLAADPPICGAGIDVRQQTGGEDFGWFVRTPCVRDGRPRSSCPQFTPPTPQDLEQAQQEEARALSQVRFIVAAIQIIKARHTAGDGSGQVPCPACGAPLDYAIFGYNRHTRGICRGEGCLRWME